MNDGQDQDRAEAEPPRTAAEWVREHQGFLTILSSAAKENDVFTVEDTLERIAPAPHPDADNVRVRERMAGDVAVVEYEVYDPRTKKLGNADGPAVVKADGTRKWYLSGMLHNAAGPAVLRPNGDMEFFYLGTKYDDAEDLDATVARARKHAERSKNFRNAHMPSGGGADAED